MSSVFKRNKEDFKCLHCGVEVVGDGYTNHCPECLWSRHVDINPGDRAAVCGGLMPPLRLEGSADNLRLIHECEKCGLERPNRLAEKDQIDRYLATLVQ